jgi:uncharacterized protein with HEPN domain
MEADAKALLWDAREAARRIARFTDDKSFSDYLSNELLRAAVERQLSILGEALAQLRKEDPATAALIGSLARAVGMRNVLIHGYASVDHRIVWGVVEGEMGPLLAQLDGLLGDES